MLVSPSQSPLEGDGDKGTSLRGGERQILRPECLVQAWRSHSPSCSPGITQTLPGTFLGCEEADGGGEQLGWALGLVRWQPHRLCLERQLGDTREQRCPACHQSSGTLHASPEPAPWPLDVLQVVPVCRLLGGPQGSALAVPWGGSWDPPMEPSHRRAVQPEDPWPCASSAASAVLPWRRDRAGDAATAAAALPGDAPGLGGRGPRPSADVAVCVLSQLIPTVFARSTRETVLLQAPRQGWQGWAPPEDPRPQAGAVGGGQNPTHRAQGSKLPSRTAALGSQPLA